MESSLHQRNHQWQRGTPTEAASPSVLQGEVVSVDLFFQLFDWDQYHYIISTRTTLTTSIITIPLIIFTIIMIIMYCMLLIF